MDRLKFLLHGYPPSLKRYLVNGFTFGFRIGFLGERRAIESRNLKSALEQSQSDRTVKLGLQKECEAGEIIGPFSYLSFQNFVCCPIGIVPIQKDAS